MKRKCRVVIVILSGLLYGGFGSQGGAQDAPPKEAFQVSTPAPAGARITPFLPFSSQRLHELLGYDGQLAGPLELVPVTEEEGREHIVLTGDYASWVGRWEPSTLAPGQTLREPAPLFAKLDPERVVADELARMEAAATA